MRSIYCCTCTTDVDLMIQLLCPFLSVFLLPQISLWLLKSNIMKGLGKFSIKLFSSDSLSPSLGEYILNILIVLWKVSDIATACMFVFSVISLCRMLLMIIDLPQDLSVCSLI